MSPSPDPGIHANVPLDVYLGWDACSASTLKHIRDRGPAYARWRMDNPSPPTPANVKGSAVHASLLELDNFVRVYAPAGDDWRTKAGKAQKQAVEESGAVPLKTGEFEAILRMRDSVYANPEAAELLGACEFKEASVRFDRSGVPCKIRPDACSVTNGILVDLKTGRGVTGDRLERYVLTFGVALQASWYAAGWCHALNQGTVGFQHRIITVENTPPFECVVRKIHPDTMAAGREEVRRLFDLYFQCWSSGEWPVLDTEPINLPAWVLAQNEHNAAPITVGGEDIFDGR